MAGSTLDSWPTPNPTPVAQMMYTLFCMIEGQYIPFSVKINETQSVDELKTEIRKKTSNRFRNIAADKLTLYKINVDASDRNKYEDTMHAISQPDYVFNPKLMLNPGQRISRYFGQPSDRPEGNILILVEPPC